MAFYYSDPTGATAVGNVGKEFKRHERREIHNPVEEQDAAIDFYVRRVKGADSLHVLSEVMKCLGTYAEMDSKPSISKRGGLCYENHEKAISDFAWRIAPLFGGDEARNATIIKNWYVERRNDLSKLKNPLIRPLMLVLAPKRLPALYC